MAKSEEINLGEIQSFNIALFPESKQLIAECIKLAQENFSANADGYLLGKNVWPHITLCRFQADPARLKELRSLLALIKTTPLSISFDHFYIRPGRDQHANKYWVGIAVAREEQLILLQSAIHNRLSELQIESETSATGYFPHLTWARCAGDKIPIISTLPSIDFWTNQHLFNLTLGQSDKHGVYTRQLFPVDSL